MMEDKWTAPLIVNGTLVTLKHRTSALRANPYSKVTDLIGRLPLTTGAKANLISLSDIKEMKEKPKIQIQRIKSALKHYNGR